MPLFTILDTDLISSEWLALVILPLSN